MIHHRWLKQARGNNKGRKHNEKGYGEQKYKVKNRDGRIEKKGQVMNGLVFLLSETLWVLSIYINIPIG